MKATNLREKVLIQIRNAMNRVKGRTELPEPDLKAFVFKKTEDSLPETFAKEFNKNKGRFIYCKDTEDFIQQIRQLVSANNWDNIFCNEEKINTLLGSAEVKFSKNPGNFRQAEVGITACEALVARTGSIIVSTADNSTRTLSVYPPVHIVVAWFDQIFFDFENAIYYLKEKYAEKYPSMISIISGPSRTADIEKTLVLGAHGPKDIYCFYISGK